jgi:hypothetical protein
MPTLFKRPSYILSGEKRVNSLIEKGRLYLYLIMLTLFKGLSYILDSGKRVNNFIKGRRLY